MKKYLPFILLFLSSFAVAQFTVVSTQPANNATNVPLTTTISMTFSEALDTNAMNDNSEGSWFGNLDSMVSYGYSADLKTTYGTYVLQPNTPYFAAFTYVKALSGATITVPHVFYFTTGATFPATTVSGTLSPGSSGVTPEHAIIALMTIPIDRQTKEGPPPFAAWANVNSNGSFTIPYVPNGTYWPLAAKDVDHNGDINPERGVDVLALGDSIVVNNANITNVNLSFFTLAPSSFHESIHMADSLAQKLPPDRVLRIIQSNNTDSLGRSGTWKFIYTTGSTDKSYEVRVGAFENRIDSNYDSWNVQWLKQMKPLTNYATAAQSSVVMANAEAAGGLTFRHTPHSDTLELNVEMRLGGLSRAEFWNLAPDTNQMYWGVLYILGIDREPWWIEGKKYLCSFSTGTVIGSSTLSVQDPQPVPETFTLRQNYPNPFNPATTVEFIVPREGRAKVTVYNSIGQEVAVLYDDVASAGIVHRVQFNGSNLGSGLYVARLTFGVQQMMTKMLLLK